MKKAFLSLLSIISISLSACVFSSKNNDIPVNPDDDVNTELKIADPNFSSLIRNKKSEVVYTDLFNLNNKVSIDIQIDREELNLIQEDNYRGRKPEMYRVAKHVSIALTNGNNTFTWDFDNVGIRQKGNTSRQEIFKDNKVNTHNHYKLSFDETFTDTSMYDSSYIEKYGNEDLGDRDFLGLSGLDFKWNKNYDQTHIKEIYSSHMFRSAGIMYQQVGLATIKMIYDDDQVADFGLCNIYEPTSKSIIKRTLSGGGKYINMPTWSKEKDGTFGVSGKKYGDFYKCTYGRGDGYSSFGADLSMTSTSDNRVGVKTDIYGNNIPAYERKTNTESNYNDNLLKNLSSTLSSGDYAQIDEIVDLEYFAIEEAIAYFVGNPDSFRYNYNNTMLYFRRVDGKMVIMPMDGDRVLGIGKDWDKGVSFCANQYVTPLYRGDINYSDTHNRLFKKTLFASSENQCQKTFKKYIKLIRESKWVENASFNTLFDIAKTTYSEHEFTLNNCYDNISFEQFIAVKIEASKDLSIKNV